MFKLLNDMEDAAQSSSQADFVKSGIVIIS